MIKANKVKRLGSLGEEWNPPRPLFSLASGVAFGRNNTDQTAPSPSTHTMGAFGSTSKSRICMGKTSLPSHTLFSARFLGVSWHLTQQTCIKKYRTKASHPEGSKGEGVASCRCILLDSILLLLSMKIANATSKPRSQQHVVLPTSPTVPSNGVFNLVLSFD